MAKKIHLHVLKCAIKGGNMHEIGGNQSEVFYVF